MKWINTVDLLAWAKTLDCQGALPLLLRKLIRASNTTIENIKFPAGENIQIGGWDGILEVTNATEYLPLGISLWEFGASANIKGKADKDYRKRSKDSLGYKQDECTFVFVTPNRWTGSKKWVKEKKLERIWRDIKVIDAEVLEEWLEITPSVSSWLATEHLNKISNIGVQSTDFFWERWSTGPNITLVPELLLGGRQTIVKDFCDLTKLPKVIAVKDMSREDALAFALACFKSNSSLEEDFFSRSLIVENPTVFRQLSVLKTPLFLIPHFEDDGSFNYAVSKGHTLIVPLGADSSDNWEFKIVLPQIERNSFIESLRKMGISREDAEMYSKESSRNITILRRQLKFNRNLPEWAKPSNVKDVIPALLIGRWDESYLGDRAILESVAGENYDSYSKKLNKWLNFNDSPLIRIGSTWRLTSPLDAWAHAAKNLTESDFKTLSNSFELIFKDINQNIQSISDNDLELLWTTERANYSEWIKEGATQSLILISIFDTELKLNVTGGGENWVDKIIYELLNTKEPLKWKSFENKLPLISEASPKQFLSIVERNLLDGESPVIDLFEEKKGIFNARTFHTGLLWSLENLAWMPEYLSRSSLILARLAAIDPGGSIVNRPINSLKEIFKTWHFQTLAKFEDRVKVLKLICAKEKGVAWNLLNSMLPNHHGIATPTHQMRWRVLNLNLDIDYTYEDIYKTHAAVTDLLLEICDLSENQLVTLLNASVDLNLKDRHKILSFIENNLPNKLNFTYTLWNAVRKILHKNRSHPNANWALSTIELSLYQILYDKLKPQDDILENLWLFDERWPEFQDGFNHKTTSRSDQQAYINDQRLEALRFIYQKYGIEKIIDLSSQVKEPRLMGDTLGNLTLSEPDTIRVGLLINLKEFDNNFTSGFLFRASLKNSNSWAIDLYKKMEMSLLTNEGKGIFFLMLVQNALLWDFIDSTNEQITDYYWANIEPNFWPLPVNEKQIGLLKLINARRYFRALDVCEHFLEEISSPFLIELMKNAAITESRDTFVPQGYDIERIFEIFEQRGDVSKQDLLNLEWLYLPMLINYSSHDKIKMLYQELSTNPQFFMEVLELVYRSNDETTVEEIKINDELAENRIHQAYQLLHSWKSIPGLKESNIIDADYLNNWIDTVRTLASKSGRLEVADMTIGQVLAQYEEIDLNWPSDVICSIIERINTDSLRNNFSAAVYNKRGSSVRSATDGGTRERVLAKHFTDLALNHYNKFPIVASIFERLAKGYEQEALREDEIAEIRKLEY